MSDATPSARTRSATNRLFDPSAWDGIDAHSDDRVAAGHAYAGTTWLQQPVLPRLFGARTDLNVTTIWAWVDSVYPDKTSKQARLAAQTQRRVMSPHLPADGKPLPVVSRPAPDILHYRTRWLAHACGGSPCPCA